MTLTGQVIARWLGGSPWADPPGQPRRLPRMRLSPAVKDIFAFRYEDFTLEDYDPHPHIKAKVAV